MRFQLIQGGLVEHKEKLVSKPATLSWREVENERRSTIVKYLNRAFRDVVVKTSTCYIVVTVYPYPNRQPLVIFDAQMAKKAKAHGVSVLRRLDV